MILIKTEKLKDIAKACNSTVDDNQLSPVSELLELEIKNKDLYFRTTNKEQYSCVTLKDVATEGESVKVIIQAPQFLALLTKITDPFISLELKPTHLELTCFSSKQEPRARYSLGLTTDTSNSEELPVIPFNGPNLYSFTVDGNSLLPMLTFNGKELQNSTIAKQENKYCYWDKECALTYIECANAYSNVTNCEKDFKVLIPKKLLELFRLFEGKKVLVEIMREEIGRDYQNEPINQSKIRLSSDNIVIISKLPNDDLVSRFNEHAIKQQLHKEYPGEVTVAKSDIINAIERLLIFEKDASANLKKPADFIFTETGLQIVADKNANFELIEYKSDESTRFIPFTAHMSLTDIKKYADLSLVDDIKLSYGTGDSIKMNRNVYTQIIPEMATINID